MHSIWNHRLTVLILVVLLTGCAKVQPNFLVNGQDTPTVDDPRIDSVEVVSALVGIPISFTESSEPLGEVQEVLWDFNGDGEWDAGPADAYEINYAFDTPGLKHISMCVDGNMEAVITKRVLIKEEVKLQIEPELEFLSPPSSFEESSRSKYDIVVRTTNVFSASELTLSVNNEDQVFDFNGMTGELSASVKLQSGDNRVEVQAQIDGQDEVFSKLAYLVYGESKKKAPIKKKKKKDPAPTPTPDPGSDPEPTPEPEVEECNVEYQMGSAAFPSKDYTDGCATTVGEKYTMSITPKACAELSTFKLYTDVCGEVVVKLTWDGGSEQMTLSLTGGISELNIFDLGVTLEKGKTYSLSLTTQTGGTCSSTTAPALFDMSGCDGKAISSKELDLNYYGKQVIVDLEYYY